MLSSTCQHGPTLRFVSRAEKVPLWTSVFFCRCASNARFAQGQPRKNFIEQLKLLLKWMLIERWRAQHVEFNVPTCGKIAVWQLCREKQPFWNSHDGLNLTCLDQCHGVRWLTPKNCYKVYSLNLMKAIVAGLPRESFPTETCLCGHQCFSLVAHQDFPQASPSATIKWKNFIEQLKPLLEWMLYERWSRLSVQSSTCQHGPTLQSVSRAEKDSLLGTVMMAWIWHVWINAMVLVPMAQAPPKADAKELL